MEVQKVQGQYKIVVIMDAHDMCMLMNGGMRFQKLEMYGRDLSVVVMTKNNARPKRKGLWAHMFGWLFDDGQ